MISRYVDVNLGFVTADFLEGRKALKSTCKIKWSRRPC